MSVLTAIAQGDLEAVEQLLAAGASPHDRDAEGVPAVLHATDTGRADLVGALLNAGARLDATDNIGWSPLMAAVSQNNVELVGFLLNQGANANHVGREDTPLTIAIADGALVIVTLLLNHGADARLRRPDGWTPLMLAAYGGELARIRLLLEHGADPTVTMGARLTDAATVAAAHGHLDTRDLLLDASRSVAPELNSLWMNVQRWCEANAPALIDAFDITHDGDPLPPEWPELPEDAAQQLMRWGEGLPFYDYLSLSVTDAERTWKLHTAKSADGAYLKRTADALGVDEPVERVFWCDDWIPFASDQDGNLLLIDMAPRPTGVPGQLLSWSVEQGPIAVLASGITPYLHHMVNRIRRGRIRYDERSRGLRVV